MCVLEAYTLHIEHCMCTVMYNYCGLCMNRWFVLPAPSVYRCVECAVNIYVLTHAPHTHAHTHPTHSVNPTWWSTQSGSSVWISVCRGLHSSPRETSPVAKSWPLTIIWTTTNLVLHLQGGTRRHAWNVCVRQTSVWVITTELCHSEQNSLADYAGIFNYVHLLLNPVTDKCVHYYYDMMIIYVSVMLLCIFMLNTACCNHPIL